MKIMPFDRLKGIIVTKLIFAINGINGKSNFPANTDVCVFASVYGMPKSIFLVVSETRPKKSLNHLLIADLIKNR